MNIALFQKLWVLGFVVLAGLRRVEDNGDGWCGDQARKKMGAVPIEQGSEKGR